MPQILAFNFSLVTLKFSIHSFFLKLVLLKIFDIEFPYKRSYLLFRAPLPTRHNDVRNRLFNIPLSVGAL